jgi:hypothetical protein
MRLTHNEGIFWDSFKKEPTFLRISGWVSRRREWFDWTIAGIFWRLVVGAAASLSLACRLPLFSISIHWLWKYSSAFMQLNTGYTSNLALNSPERNLDHNIIHHAMKPDLFVRIHTCHALVSMTNFTFIHKHSLARSMMTCIQRFHMHFSQALKIPRSKHHSGWK